MLEWRYTAASSAIDAALDVTFAVAASPSGCPSQFHCVARRCKRYARSELNAKAIPVFICERQHETPKRELERLTRGEEGTHRNEFGELHGEYTNKREFRFGENGGALAHLLPLRSCHSL